MFRESALSFKVGEPGTPVERGKQVLVSTSQNSRYEIMTLQHSASYIPTVLSRVNIPVSIDGYWYDIQVFVDIKVAVYEPSSALRYASTLHDILLTENGTKFLYTDSGPDQRTVYISTQLSLIALFLNLNLDCCQDCSSQFLKESIV